MEPLKFLNRTQVEKYQSDGFLVLNNFITEEVCEILKERAAYLVGNYNNAEEFSCFAKYVENSGENKSKSIRESSDKINFFLEEKAVDEKNRKSWENKAPIMKIGHALHDCDPVFSKFSRQDRLRQIADDLSIHSPLLVQSMYFYKLPGIGGEVASHQDASFLYTTPISVTGFWFALEDAKIENSCLWAVPGSHKRGLQSKFVRSSEGEKFEYYSDTEVSQSNFVALEVPKGSLILLDGLLIHKSEVNHSQKSRQAYTLHIVDGNTEYAKSNWLQRPQHNPFKGF